MWFLLGVILRGEPLVSLLLERPLLLLLLLTPVVVQVAVAHPVDDLGQLADPAQLADYYSGHFLARGERSERVGRDSKNTKMARDETRETPQGKMSLARLRTNTVF